MSKIKIRKVWETPDGHLFRRPEQAEEYIFRSKHIDLTVFIDPKKQTILMDSMLAASFSDSGYEYLESFKTQCRCTGEDYFNRKYYGINNYLEMHPEGCSSDICVVREVPSEENPIPIDFIVMLKPNNERYVMLKGSPPDSKKDKKAARFSARCWCEARAYLYECPEDYYKYHTERCWLSSCVQRNNKTR